MARKKLQFFEPEVGRWVAPLEKKFLLDLNRAAERSELMGESVSQLKVSLATRFSSKVKDLGGPRGARVVSRGRNGEGGPRAESAAVLGS